MTTENVDIEISHKATVGSGVQQDVASQRYYYNSESTRIFIEEVKIDKVTGYKKITHIPQSGKIDKIKHNSVDTKISDLNGKSSVSVFYWTGDGGHKNPLIVQLGDGNDKYYVHNYPSYWTFVGYIAPSGLLLWLDKCNCRHNTAHIADISRKSGKYCCYACNKAEVTLQPSNEGEYLKVTQNFTGNIGRIKGLADISEVQITQNMSTIDVYCYPVDGQALLINLSSVSQWIKRRSKDDGTWDREDDDLNDDNGGKTKILNLLKEIYGDPEPLPVYSPQGGISNKTLYIVWGISLPFIVYGLFELYATWARPSISPISKLVNRLKRGKTNL